MHVHVPFMLQDLAQVEERLGFFSENSTRFIKEFKYLSQTYDLTWKDIDIILSSSLTSEEQVQFRQAARDEADKAR